MADNNVVNNNEQQPAAEAATLPVSNKTVCQWALLNACVFAATSIAALTDAAAAELIFLLYGELGCSVATALAAPLHMLMLLTTRTTTTSRWAAAAVDYLAWVALAATAGIHCMEVASDCIFLAAYPGDKYIFADVAFLSVCLAVDLLAGVLLCCSPRRLEMGEQQGDDDGEV